MRVVRIGLKTANQLRKTKKKSAVDFRCLFCSSSPLLVRNQIPLESSSRKACSIILKGLYSPKGSPRLRSGLSHKKRQKHGNHIDLPIVVKKIHWKIIGIFKPFHVCFRIIQPAIKIRIPSIGINLDSVQERNGTPGP